MLEEDVIRRFIFEDLGVRGSWVKLSHSWQAAKAHQQAPENVKQQLGQALAAIVMLSATIKYKGTMILQAETNGVIKTLVAQSSDDREIRGLVRCNEHAAGDTSASLFGQGRLVLTIDSGAALPYQGIVPLEGDNLAIALETYFIQSEQLNTRLWLFANNTTAAGLLLQELPTEGTDKTDSEHLEILANTVTQQEMLELGCEALLQRLFSEEKLRLFDAQAVKFKCSCSRSKITQTLVAMGKEELETMLLELGSIEVICEFCGEHYRFDAIDVSVLWSHSLCSKA